MRDYTTKKKSHMLNIGSFENRIVEFPEQRTGKGLLSDTLRLIIRNKYQRVEKSYMMQTQIDKLNSAA